MSHSSEKYTLLFIQIRGAGPRWQQLGRRLRLFMFLMLSVIGFSTAVHVQPVGADPLTPDGSILLSGAGPIQYPSPTLVDLNGDGKQEILVGTTDGKAYALRYNSATSSLVVMWSHNTSADLGCPTAIRGSLSAADLTGDGIVEVVVPVGEANTNTCGGLVVLNGQTGNVIWSYKTFDLITNINDVPVPDGISDVIASTPALGDLDNDGKLEIAIGAFDQRIYVFRFDGTQFPGWPRFVRDTVWSSPALADMDNDGFLEVIVGQDSFPEGPPFNKPQGGILHVFRRDGTELPGWPQIIYQTIQSSPAVGDLNGDGDFEIVTGTGDWWNNPDAGYKVYAWNKSGNLLWTGNTNGYVLGSPALGDLDGSGTLKVVVGAKDNKVYAWNSNGTPFWSVTPTNYQGLTSTAGLYSPGLVDYNGDGKPEAFINIFSDSAILNGLNGNQLTADSYPNDPLPAYTTSFSTVWNSPGLGDIDGDGKLELVLASANSTYTTGRVFFWRLNTNAPADPGNTSTVPWPMFGQNARHTRVYPKRPALDSEVVSHTFPSIMAPNQQLQVSITLRNTGTSSWTASDLARLGAVGDSDPFTAATRINLNPGESVAPGQARTFTITLQAPSTPGLYTTDWRMVKDSTGTWFGRAIKIEIKVGCQPAIHDLTTQGMYAVGLATTPFSAPPGYSNWGAVKAWKVTADKRGYYLLDGHGGMWAGGAAMPLFGTPSTPNPYWGQDLVLGPDGISYFALVADGTIYGCNTTGCNVTFNPATPTGITARSLALTADGKGVYVVDGFGNVYRGGTAPALSLPPGLPQGSDIIRRIKLTPNGTGYYLMDMYGRIWNGGSAPPMTLGYTPQIGVDWARDFELTADGTGFYLLTRNNVIYTGGTAAPLVINLPPTSTGDIGRDLEVTDGRCLPKLKVSNLAFTFLHQAGTNSPVQASTTISNTGPYQLNWTAVANPPSALSLSPSNGSVVFGSPSQMQMSVNNPASYAVGTYNLTVTVAGSSSFPVESTPQVVSITLVVANNFWKIYLPVAIR